MNLDVRNQLTNQSMLSIICVSNQPLAYFVDPYKLCDLKFLEVAQ